MTNKRDLMQRITVAGAGLIILSTAAIGYGQIKTNNLEKINRELTSEVKELRQHTSETTRELDSLQQELSNLKQESKGVLSENKELKIKIEELNKKVKQNNSAAKSDKPSRSGGRLLGTFEATAYDDSVESQGQWVGQTATGVKPQVGVIAVDPKVIPLGTKLYVEGYGNCTAADTGGAIKGNRIDVFKNTASEVRAWGRRQVKVYIRE